MANGENGATGANVCQNILTALKFVIDFATRQLPNTVASIAR